ncbi:MAG: hypothetical protein P1V20_02680, partial [Verrucomicrobiales bacterium]|nr:hypothetical protein [Verrucomicrobiales bacterium]
YNPSTMTDYNDYSDRYNIVSQSEPESIFRTEGGQMSATPVPEGTAAEPVPEAAPESSPRRRTSLFNRLFRKRN